MKRLKEISICLGVGLVLSAGASTDDAVVPDNPYASIAQRNVFGLNPPVAVAVTAPPVKPPPKITLNGITSIFGRWEVLFKVSGAENPGQPSKERAYVLEENQSQDDINVIRIDAQAEMVSFNNHGIVQEIPLICAPGGMASRMAMNEPEASPEVTVPKSYPPEFVRARTPDYLGGGQVTTNKTEPLTNTSLKERIILIEAQRALLKSQNDPAADELPPTALTPTDTGASKGS